MKIGIAPLSIGVAVAAMRLTDVHIAADMLGYLYLSLVTLTMMRKTARLQPHRI